MTQDDPRELFLEFLQEVRSFIDEAIDRGRSVSAVASGTAHLTLSATGVAHPGPILGTTTIPTPVVNGGVTAADMIARTVDSTMVARVLTAVRKVAPGTLIGVAILDKGVDLGLDQLMELAKVVLHLVTG